MKKAYRNMALAAAVVLSASSLLGCNSIVQIPDALKVQQGNANLFHNSILTDIKYS